MLTLDTTGLLCPMPVIKVQNQMKTMDSGEHLVVTCSDPGTLNDIPTWCRINGHQVLETKQTDTEIIFTLQKK